MNSTVGRQRGGWNWHAEDGVIKLPVTEQPLSIYQYELWQAKKMNWLRMNGCGGRKKEKKSKELYLSNTENRVYVETKGAFYGKKLFSVCNIRTLIRCIILKNRWCNSLPGPPRCSRDQSSRILKLDVFQLLPAKSFSCPTLFRLLFTDAPFVVPELFPLMGPDVCAVSSTSALTKKTKDRKKGNTLA